MIDCILIAETLRCGDFEPSKLGDEAMIELRQLIRLHQELKGNVADLKRQVIVALDQVFPEYDSIFSNMFGESSKAFLNAVLRLRSVSEYALIPLQKHLSVQAAENLVARKPTKLKTSPKHLAVSASQLLLFRFRSSCSLTKLTLSNTR